MAILENYTRPEINLNRSRHHMWYPTYEEARTMAASKYEVPIVLPQKEFKEVEPFYIATLSNGNTSKKLHSMADVIEYLGSLETDVDKITIRRKYKEKKSQGASVAEPEGS